MKRKLYDLIGAENSYTILLSHRPELFDSYVGCKVDLALCAPNQRLFPEYEAGINTDGRTSMVASRGIGTRIIPFRFNNRLEIVMIELNNR